MSNLLIRFFRSYSFLCAMLCAQVAILSIGTSELRNSKLLVDAGTDLINGKSPYTTPNPYGSWPGLIFFLIDKVALFGTTAILILLLNLAGYVFLIKFLFVQIELKNLLIITIISMFTSPIRALFSNVQNTGLILGSALLGVYFYRLSKSRFKFLFMVLSSFSFLFALELKPQVVLPFIVVFIVQARGYKLLVFIFIQLVLIRLMVNFWVGQVLEIQQFRIWKVMRTDNLAIREQISIWKITDHFVNFQINWLLVSFILTIFLNGLLIICALKSESKNLLRLALVLPLLSGYMQYYSLLPLLAIIIFQVINNNFYRQYGFMFGLIILVLPTHQSTHLRLVEFFLVLAVNVFISISIGWDFATFVKNLLESILAIFTVHFVSQIFMDVETYLSLTLYLVYLIEIPFLIKYFKLLTSSGKSFKTIEDGLP